MRTTPATRNFAPDPVSDEVLHRVLDNARFAPSGGNRQPWRVVIVRDAEARRDLRDQYVDAYRETMTRRIPSLDRFAEHLDEVPVLLVVCVELASLAITDRSLDRQSIVGGASIYPFVQNILLGLRNEGLAGLVTTVACAREPELRRIFSIPEGFAVACVIPAGRPARAAIELSRRPVEEFATVDWFGGPPFPGARG
jgi:nitroreductase